MKELLAVLLAFLTTLGPVVVCLCIPGLALVALFIGLLVAGGIQRAGLKSTIQKATPVLIRELTPQLKLVRLSGVISQIREPIDPEDPALAMLRVQINGRRYNMERLEYGGVWGKTKATPLLINDSSGSIWVEPRPIDSRLLGEGMQVDYESIRKPCQILGADVDKVTRGARNLVCYLWEWRVGQWVTVFGNLQQTNGEWTIVRLKGQPMMVTPLELDQLAEIAGKKFDRSQMH
jgi:hypothetical protein